MSSDSISIQRNSVGNCHPSQRASMGSQRSSIRSIHKVEEPKNNTICIGENKNCHQCSQRESMGSNIPWTIPEDKVSNSSSCYHPSQRKSIGGNLPPLTAIPVKLQRKEKKL